MAPDAIRRHVVIYRQIFGALAGGNDAKAGGARPVHHLGGQRRLIAIGQRINHARFACFLGQQRAGHLPQEHQPLDGGRLKSPHTIEIPFAFDNVKASRLTSSSPEAQTLADKVSDTWIAFARKGDPNTGKLPRWPAFNPKDRPTMVFNTESKVENDPIREQRIAMWEAMKLV